MYKERFKSVPSVTFLIDALGKFCPQRKILKFCIDESLTRLRKKIAEERESTFSNELLIDEIKNRYRILESGSLKPVINATGVLLHTNLGRSPLSEEIFEKVKPLVTGYCNIEYDLKKGKRGERYEHVSDYFKILTGAEDALVVNNNAAAVFLVLNTFAKKKEVIISRGELVEIGGSFRIPEVMKNSGAILKEVGTTNKTRISDYSESVSSRTSVLMKVHKSNYEILGFVEETAYGEIPAIATSSGIISYYDMGSGFIGNNIDMICPDMDVKKVIESGFDLVSISGDKLLGAVQCGIILGKSKYIDKLRKNQLLRMLRVDKITLGILQESLKLYLEGNANSVRYLSLVKRELKELEQNGYYVLKLVGGDKNFTIEPSKAFLGGGSCPLKEIDSISLVCSCNNITAIERKLRNVTPPIITRIYDNKIYIDLLAVSTEELDILADGLKWALT